MILAGCASGPASSREAAGRVKSIFAAGKSGAFSAEESEAEYEKNVQAYSHFSAGLSYDLNGKHDLALEEYVQAATANPSDEPMVLDVTRRLVRAEKFDRALELLKLASSKPEASGALFAWLGLVYNQTGQREQAIAANRAAIKKMPDALPAYHNLTQLYLQQNKTNEALKVLDDAAAQRKVEPEFLVDLAELYYRLIKAKPDGESMTNRIVRVLDRAADLKPANPVTQQKLADGYYQVSEFKKAEPIYVELLKRFPSPLLQAKLAELYLRTDQKQKATEQLQAIAKADPTNPRTHSFLGAIALEDDKLPEAAKYFETALLLNPDLEPVYYELAGINLNLKKPKEALEWLEKARAKFKLNFLLELYTGLSYFELKNYSVAIRHLTSAEVVAKADSPERLTPSFYFRLGAVYERNGDYDQSETAFKKCLEMLPEYADALNYLGYMWADRGVKLNEARDMIQKALKIEPKNAAFLDSMGWVLFKLNEPAQGLDYILKAIELSEEPDPVLYDHLGDIYRALNQHEKARESWQKSLKVEENDQIRKKLEAAPPDLPAPRC